MATNSISIQDLIQSELQTFIAEHEHGDEKALILKHKVIHHVPSFYVAEQIIGRRKSKAKIPLLYSTPGIIYPPGVNLEQCSSELTARFKAELVRGKKVADLTGGFGIDTFFLSKKFEVVHAVEPNVHLLEIVRHNHHQLGASNITYHPTTAEDFLKEEDRHFDLIYIDPSRRANGNQKVYKLSDCEPDISKLQKVIFEKTPVLLVKCSPLLDLHQGLKELDFVERVLVISVDNECKEVLFLCRKGFASEAIIETMNLSAHTVDHFTFRFSEEQTIQSEFSKPLEYLYEPNAAILKAGAFKSIGDRFNLCKLHPSTHYYTAANWVEDFPGRVFKIEALIKPDSAIAKKHFPDTKANVTTRNYPLTPAELKKKTKLRDGGEKYLIGFSGMKEKYLAVGLRIK